MSDPKIPNGLDRLPDDVIEIVGKLPEVPRQCPECGREVIRFWRHCPRCGAELKHEERCIITTTEVENAVFILTCLISYSERVGGFERIETLERYAAGLRYELRTSEQKFEDENGGTVQKK